MRVGVRTCVCVFVSFSTLFFFRIICGIKLLLCWSTWTSLAMPEGQHEAQDDTTHRVLASTALAFISATLSSSSSSAFSAHQDHYSCSWCSSLSFSGMIVVVYLGTQTSEITQTHTHTRTHMYSLNIPLFEISVHTLVVVVACVFLFPSR